MPPPKPTAFDARVDRDSSLLAATPVGDDDTGSLLSRSQQDTDSEDDQLVARARNSRELRARDRLVLMEEEEMDKLVTDSRAKQEGRRRGSGLVLPNPLSIFKGGSRSRSASPMSIDSDVVEEVRYKAKKREERRERRKKRKDRMLKDAQYGEDGELMYEMESGSIIDGSSTGYSSERDSEELDRRNLKIHADKKSKRRQWNKSMLTYAILLVGFAFLTLLAYKMTRDKKRDMPPLVSNGTALFAPTTLIISLDGFRADFLNRGLTPRMNAFVKEGVSPLYMNPSFPSVTFPNHYTLATGLYPESHGVVGNNFWDPALKAEFFYTDPARSMDPKWWGGDPFWVTAEQQGLRTAVHMWPGSEAHILGTEPSFLDKFDGKEVLSNKVDRILELLDKPGMEDPTADLKDKRPQLIAAYVPNVDADGHRYGPNSTQVRQTIKEVDTMLDQLFHGMEERNLTNIVNVIIVSDHGMATSDITRMIQMEDLIDMSKVDHVDGWPLVGIRPKDPAHVQELYDQAAEKGKTNPNFDVYLTDKNMPERYHFSNNDRIAPLWIVPKTGWAIVKKEEFDIEEGKAKGLQYKPRGLHGYDHEHPLMRAIFIARGPAFPHEPNSKVEPFQNIEVYNILCDSLGMKPMPNNGTLRLPLKTVGLHEPGSALEDPAEVDTFTIAEPEQTTSQAAVTVDPVATPTQTTQAAVTVNPVDTPAETTAAAVGVDPVDTPGEGGESDNDKTSALLEYWNWLTDKLDELWSEITAPEDGSGDNSTSGQA